MSKFKELLELKNNKNLKKNATLISFREPRILTIIKNDNLQLCSPFSIKYFKKPNSESYPLDLNIGYDKYKFRNEGYFTFNLRKLEKFLMENNGRSLLMKNNKKQKICTSRNVLVTLMMTPYRRWAEWSMKAIKFGNVIYLTKYKEHQRENSKHVTYPYKLQQYCFSDTPHGKTNTTAAINENNQISSIFQNSIGNFEIFYGAEIMGIETEHEVKNFNESELNKYHFVITKLLIKYAAFETSKYHPSALVWYLQGKLTKANKIYVGLRDMNGFVHEELEEFTIDDLPINQKWDPDVCKAFLNDFLLHITSAMSDIDCPYTTATFQFNVASGQIEYQIFEQETYNEDIFLTNTFIQYMDKN